MFTRSKKGVFHFPNCADWKWTAIVLVGLICISRKIPCKLPAEFLTNEMETSRYRSNEDFEILKGMCTASIVCVRSHSGGEKWFCFAEVRSYRETILRPRCKISRFRWQWNWKLLFVCGGCVVNRVHLEPIDGIFTQLFPLRFHRVSYRNRLERREQIEITENRLRTCQRVMIVWVGEIARKSIFTDWCARERDGPSS